MKVPTFFIDKARRFSTLWIMVAAFLCYTGMYAVRKSFLAGQYLDLGFGFNMDAKTVLVISQVLGYLCSKFLGIKVISEMPHQKRGGWLIGLVGFALLMLLVFAYAPPVVKVLALFFNGLPLGMVFGVVFSYLEGRKNTELLAAGLSTTFIFSTGLVKTVGVMLIQNLNISENMMPFITGLLFFPLFLVSVLMLGISKKPSREDIKERSKRLPMTKNERKEFLRQHGIGFSGLVLIYILLTIVRDFRDNFIVEFWSELGYAQKPGLITLTEVPVAIIVLVIAAFGVLLRDSYKAFNWSMWLTASGGILILIASVLFKEALVSPVAWIIATGVGVYLPYILFHCLIFERLVAFLRAKGNVGFLFYTADALGYLGSVFILFYKELIDNKGSLVSFFEQININASIVVIIGSILTMVYFKSKYAKRKEHLVPGLK
ncbi:DUF5690 family protein [Snuella sedimenti]|uniref:DUF5690 family protein n=1 Tax=Snuella sedimenti TaxID=2798802 RepID=UPI001E48ED72|nr:DUF5690 family protein [Snuella sedimenti]